MQINRVIIILSIYDSETNRVLYSEAGMIRSLIIFVFMVLVFYILKLMCLLHEFIKLPGIVIVEYFL
jgi:hypothetical protein